MQSLYRSYKEKLRGEKNVKISERIHYNSAEVVQRVEAALDRLKPFQYDTKYREILGPQLIGKITFWDQNIRKRKDDPFTLVICGEFKRGKSSLINALLMEDTVPVNVTTETVTLNRISYGFPKNEAVLSGGKRLTLTDDELCRSSLERLMEEAGEPIERLELQRPIDILKDITMIDTPGLQDSIKDFSETVAEALQQADAVLYVMSMTMPMSRSEMIYLKTCVLPQKYTSLFMAANFADMADSESDLDRVRESIEKKMKEMIPGQKIWMLSALDEQCRQKQCERPKPALNLLLEEEFDSFREQLSSLVSSKKEHVLPDRMERMLRIMYADLEDDLAALERGVQMSGQEIQEAADRVRREKEDQAQRLESCSRQLDAMIDDMKLETAGWMSDLIFKLKEKTEDLSSYSVDELSKYYPFFCIDTVQEAMTKCVDYHMDEIYDFLEQMALKISSDLLKGYEGKQYNFRFAITGKTWTKGDSVGFTANALFGSLCGGLISVAADTVGGIMRKREIKNRKPELIQSIRNQYDALLPAVKKNISETYDELGKRTKKMMAGYYEEKLDSLQSQVEQSAMASRADEARKKEIMSAAGQLRAVLKDIEQMIDSLETAS